MSVEQAYINGFVKRASQYGYNYYEAVSLLKQAKDGGMFSSLGQGFNNLKNKLTPPSRGYNQPIGPTQPSIGYDAPLEPKQDPMWPAPAPGAPKSHIPQGSKNVASEADQDSNISSEVNDQLTSIPLSGMTPKNHWEQGLHDIMAKKPVFNPQLIPLSARIVYENKYDNSRPMVHGYGPEGAEGDYNGYSAVKAPQPVSIASEHARDLLNAASSPAPEDYTRGMGTYYGGEENVENNPYIHQIREHFKKFDPSWGESFSLPIQKFQGAGDDDENFDYSQGVKDLDNYRENFPRRFQNFLNKKTNQSTGDGSPYQITSRND